MSDKEETIRVEFIGPQAGSMLYRHPSGREYQAGLLDDRFNDMPAEDAQYFVNGWPYLFRVVPDEPPPPPEVAVPKPRPYRQSPSKVDRVIEKFNRHRAHGGTKSLREICEEEGVSYEYARKRRRALTKGKSKEEK